ncbi:ATP-dependent helicase [Candidatus Halobonum tyrrellensis]|uniref:ATP-dependent helicase n=1 Tax=Candidatus Halobonum tyrrellensis G22 TaxID=1324957 RepID=V4HI68_9EURY|nr:ATP-dependent helicase [Candidatus Halobonum tyrrellensis]ESP89458.1 ATP-dependent helicase [Candidatus Halobonum tyrrellensis G22]
MSGRELLAARADEHGYEFDPATVDIADGDTLDRLEPAVREWWVDRFGAYVPGNGGFFTPPQREAIPLIDEGENCLICSPTGSGKTLASFTAIINDLFRRERESAAGLDNAVYCLYVSPLKSLANDINRNLADPLAGVQERLAERGHDTGLRQAIRHGDTADAERRRMLETTPHILNTTPETLAILLNSPKFKEKLRSVEYVVVDEIHSLAENKRGTHLAVSLERLERLCEGSPTRIGCSATVEPLSTMAEFLVGRERRRVDGADGESEAGGTAVADASEARDDASATGVDGDGAADDYEYVTREYELVDTRFVREFDLRLECPTDDLIGTPRETVTDRFYDRLHELVGSHENTLVFTNTRSGAERVLGSLRDRFDAYDEDNSGCHHGSMSTEAREGVEESLKAGDVDVVTSSTSLELGIDMPHLDLVVQVGSPKSVASLLQRVGRAGHRLGETVEGRVIALDRDELVECAVMLKKAEEGFVDRVFVPENAQDVAAQQVYGMAINGVRRETEVLETLRSAYPYRNYGDADWESLLRYLTADYAGMEEKNVYAKVWRDTNDAPDGEHHYPEFDVGEPLVGKRGRLARVIYMQNIGTIPDSFTCEVHVRGGDERVGHLDESYLDTLEPGDVFQIGGGTYEFRYRRGSKVYVDHSSSRPTVPSWFSERLPLSYDLGREILAFQGELVDRLDRGGLPAAREWLRGFPMDENSVRAVARMFDRQVRYAGPESVATDGRVVVEEERDREAYRRRYYVHSGYGRRFNDGLSRLVAGRCSRRTNANVQVAVADNGFTVSMPLNRKADVAGALRDIEPDEVAADLRSVLDGTDLLKRYFRINATRALMILKRYKGYEKSAAQQQVSSEMLISFAEERDSFAVLEETYREIAEDKLNLAGVREVLEAVQAGEIDVVHREVDSPSPRAFGLATLAASDVVLAEDESAALRDFHDRVLDEIGGDDDASEILTDAERSRG